MRVSLLLGIGILLLVAGCTTGQVTNQSATEGTTILVTPEPTAPTPTPEPAPTEPPVTTIPDPQPAVQTYTLADVAQHSTASDCWTAIEGKVYDITPFIPGHPGGPVIIQACGKDGTTLFETRNGRGPHPSKAQETLQQYYIGDLSAP